MTYRIHLGSGASQVAESARHLCIVPKGGEDDLDFSLGRQPDAVADPLQSDAARSGLSYRGSHYSVPTCNVSFGR